MPQRIEAVVKKTRFIVLFDTRSGWPARCFYCLKPGRSQHIKIVGIRIAVSGIELRSSHRRKRVTKFVEKRLLHGQSVCDSKVCQGRYLKEKSEAYGNETHRIIW
jgi:hypothetical protein